MMALAPVPGEGATRSPWFSGRPHCRACCGDPFALSVLGTALSCSVSSPTLRHLVPPLLFFSIQNLHLPLTVPWWWWRYGGEHSHLPLTLPLLISPPVFQGFSPAHAPSQL